MKSLLKRFLLVFLLLVSVGCTDDPKTTLTETSENTQNYQVTLIDADDSLIEEMTDLGYQETIVLPEPAKEGYVFSGWAHQENIYFDEYVVKDNITLKAVYEAIDDVFDYIVNETDKTAIIKAYTGSAHYLRIPSHIDGNVVEVIGTEAFKNSSLKKLLIHNNVYKIENHAFAESEQLSEIAFYGEVEKSELVTLTAAEYQNILSDAGDDCTIVSGSEEEGQWTFSSGCPIEEVTHLTEPVWVDINRNGLREDDEVYQSIMAWLSLQYFPQAYIQSFESFAFADMQSLTSLSFSKYLNFFEPSRLFEGSPEITEVSIDNDNPFFSSEAGILYSKDLTTLIYVPSNTDVQHFSISETVTTITNFAFAYNQNIEEIHIHERVTNITAFSFSEMRQLKAINVAEENTQLLAIDGILYRRSNSDDKTLILVKYPNAKSGHLFVLPDNVSTISPRAFEYNRHLEQIVLNQGLEVIADMAFAYAEKLTMLDIPETVLTLGRRLLYESSVDTLIIRRSINLGSITQLISPLEASVTVYVPDDSLSYYNTHQYWMFSSPELHPLSAYDA